jgi:hypothetical protein
MEEWLKEREWSSCVYCGDGGGDFEGAMKVPAVCGVILARQGWTLDQRLAAASPAAKVKTWTDQVALDLTNCQTAAPLGTCKHKSRRRALA